MKGDLLKSCAANHPAHKVLVGFSSISASFAEIGMEVGEEVEKGNHPNIGNWKYLKKEKNNQRI